MQSAVTKMRESRLICDKEMEIQQQRLESFHLDFQKYLQSLFSKSEQNLEAQDKLRKLKVELREADAELVKSLAAKTKKEAERMAILDSVSATKARIEELKALLEDQTNRKEEYSEMVSQQSRDLMELQGMHNQSIDRCREIEEAISWYNKVLGLQIECGHGVKFIFTNIDRKDPTLQYSFTIRFANEVYSLLDCNPPLIHTNELLLDLNRTNGLFKFVRTIREKFQETVTNEPTSTLIPTSEPALVQADPPHITKVFLRRKLPASCPSPASSLNSAPSDNLPIALRKGCPETSLISLSAPVSSVSTDCGRESPSVIKKLQLAGTDRRKTSTSRGGTQATKSPGPARVKGKK